MLTSPRLGVALFERGVVSLLTSSVLAPAAPTTLRGVRLMALTFLSNAVASPEGAAHLPTVDGAAAAVFDAALRSLRDGASRDAPDVALAQIGGAISYNLAHNLPTESSSSMWAPLLSGAFAALPAQSDGETICRLVCALGQLLLRFGDEVCTTHESSTVTLHSHRSQRRLLCRRPCHLCSHDHSRSCPFSSAPDFHCVQALALAISLDADATLSSLESTAASGARWRSLISEVRVLFE